MAEKSLFAVLLRSPWWISWVLALAVVLIAKAWLPQPYFFAGAIGGLPFVVIGMIAAWRQLRAPSPAQVQAALERLNALSWRDFSAALELALQRDGYVVQRLSGDAADFSLVKAGRTTLLSCKRWKGARLGAEPLQALQTAQRDADAAGALCITLGELTDQARQFAVAHQIRVMRGDELAMLLRSVLPKSPVA